MLSCDSVVNGCFGVNLESGTCPAETVLATGEQDGLACYECIGEETGDVFNLFWRTALLSGTSNPGIQFGVLNTTDSWLAEFTGCLNITLYVAERDEFGRFVKGDLAGTLADVDPFQIDRLSFFMDIPGFRTEQVTCGFCSTNSPPACLGPLPYL